MNFRLILSVSHRHGHSDDADDGICHISSASRSALAYIVQPRSFTVTPLRDRHGWSAATIIIGQSRHIALSYDDGLDSPDKPRFSCADDSLYCRYCCYIANISRYDVFIIFPTRYDYFNWRGYNIIFDDYRHGFRIRAVGSGRHDGHTSICYGARGILIFK